MDGWLKKLLKQTLIRKDSDTVRDQLHTHWNWVPRPASLVCGEVMINTMKPVTYKRVTTFGQERVPGN
jgi:hypothetical protein